MVLGPLKVKDNVTILHITSHTEGGMCFIQSMDRFHTKHTSENYS